MKRTLQRIKAAMRAAGIGLGSLLAAGLITQSIYAASVSIPPVIVKNVAPTYPLQAIRQRHQGTVLLLILVDVSGNPKHIRIEKSSGFAELDRAAVEAAQQWRYRPKFKDGVEVESYVRTPVNFNLKMGTGPELPIAIGALSDELLHVELPEGRAYTADLETGHLIDSQHAPRKSPPGQHIFPSLPSDPSGYVQTLETAYHDAYVTALAHGEPPASRCLIDCMRTAWLRFSDGSIGLVDVQDESSQGILLSYEGLPSADDARAAATINAYLHHHPGLEMADWELVAKAGPAVKSARLYYYDLSSEEVSAMAKLQMVPPQPPPPPSLPQSDGPSPPQEVCRSTLVRGVEHTIADSADEIPMVTVVVNHTGLVEHEWIVHSSGKKWVDSSALNDASRWTFNGSVCEGQRITESVGISR